MAIVNKIAQRAMISATIKCDVEFAQDLLGLSLPFAEGAFPLAMPCNRGQIPMVQWILTHLE